MALNSSKCNHLTPLCFKRLKSLAMIKYNNYIGFHSNSMHVLYCFWDTANFNTHLDSLNAQQKCPHQNFPMMVGMRQLGWWDYQVVESSGGEKNLMTTFLHISLMWQTNTQTDGQTDSIAITYTVFGYNALHGINWTYHNKMIRFTALEV